MDRWLCAALIGYALTFTFSKPMTIQQWLLLTTLVAVLSWRRFGIRRYTSVLGCILCGIAWGSGNAYLHQITLITGDNMGKTVPLMMTVTEISQTQPDFWRIQGTVKSIQNQRLSIPATVRLSWYEPPTQISPPQAGTTWQFQARLKAPQGVRNDGGFLYHRYLTGQKIHALGSIRSGSFVAGEPNYRQRVYNRLAAFEKNLSQFGILQALTLGERQALSAEQWQTYQRTGLAHLIAISGLHLTLVAAGVLWLSRKAMRYYARSRSRRETTNSWVWATCIALTVTFFYAGLAGFATATIRAFVMFSVVIIHKYFALHTPSSRVLLRAVAVVILAHPLAPLQSGFWLSVVAVATILLMNWRWPIIQGRWRGVRALWRLELTLTFAMWPLTAMWFGGLPILAPLTNLVVVPIVTFWVLPLSLLGLFSLVVNAETISLWLFRIAELPLSYAEPILSYLANSSWQWLPAHLTGPIISLVVLVLTWVWPWHWRYKISCIAVFCLGLVIRYQLHQYDTQVKFHILDVDQGSAIVIAQADEAVIVDTGANWELGGNMAERVILPFLQQHHLTPVYAFVSHTDNDHQGGVATIAARFPALRWFGSGHGLPCVAGQTGQWRRVAWQVLHPRRVTNNEHNDDSCVLKFMIGESSVLVPGDITKRAERSLLAHIAPVQADILVLAHHGSNSSSENYFLQAVSPYFAIASRGRNNAYGMVAEQVKQRLEALSIRLVDTARGGQITVTFDQQKWWIDQPWAGTNRAWFDADN
ncbi:DNA internalization-related competence protein ComEC/Rec2 [Pseudidiomarina marina]|uniref:DNA internalization-related competence protein ComEC/Rec2 n=1 Tax=Pseudidiomarina marina TaxID=502366 RepID=A0A432YIW7_9GAMM|nr:DNA internalization-related competence protein ComEC/Rec2 [Pseudidiomarina marina]RUO60929.1 DNA internalization-related competence protein ComEC/Rec2 [Pseudidiomarina marina]